ncbi:CdvA-like protein [Candidatus Bathyarchaeota archaeon]|nr:CdvA-like protein [Candidatus Bathyarchaeota archaeon]
MTEEIPQVFFSLGKQVKDEYGRPIGKIASFQLNPHGQVDGIFIQHGDGEFKRYPAEQLKFDRSDTVILLSPIKAKGNRLCNEIPLIWRKDQALKELLENNKVPQELYEGLHNSFEGALNQLKAEAQAVIEKIDKRIVECNEQIKELNSALINLEIERHIGKVDDTLYNNAMEIIQQNLRWANLEKEELESLKNKLSNIMLGENLTEQQPEKSEEQKVEETEKTEEKVEEAEKQETTSSLPEPPEQPFVVYVKDTAQET